MLEPIDMIKCYASSRDAVLDCQYESKMFSCESCPKAFTEDREGRVVGTCPVRDAWTSAYNSLNAMAQPNKPDITKLPEYREMLKMSEVIDEIL